MQRGEKSFSTTEFSYAWMLIVRLPFANNADNPVSLPSSPGWSASLKQARPGVSRHFSYVGAISSPYINRNPDYAQALYLCGLKGDSSV
jgi:hypothetical protein